MEVVPKFGFAAGVSPRQCCDCGRGFHGNIQAYRCKRCADDMNRTATRLVACYEALQAKEAAERERLDREAMEGAAS